MDIQRTPSLRYVPVLLMMMLFIASHRVAGSASELDWCPQICNQQADCETPCLADSDPAFESTCGNYSGGASSGWCDDGAYCGDSVCDETVEACSNCPQDCGPCPEPGDVRYPDGDIDWSTIHPDGSHVGDCFANCGAGCSDHVNVCGGPAQYWELELLSEPTTETRGHGKCQGTDLILITYEAYVADGRWTYHGWVKPGCISHDYYCNEWLVGCAMWAGCGDPGWTDTWSYELPLERIKQYLAYENLGYDPICD